MIPQQVSTTTTTWLLCAYTHLTPDFTPITLLISHHCWPPLPHINLNTYPQQWKTTTTAVQWKPDKPDYTVAKAYRPIMLMETLAKPLSGCVAEYLSYQAEKQPTLLLFTVQMHIQWCRRSWTGIQSFRDGPPQASAYMHRNLSILNVVVFRLVVILS